MKRFLMMCALMASCPLLADPSQCLEMHGSGSCNSNGSSWQKDFYNKVGMSVSINSDSGNLQCDGSCQTTNTKGGFVITDTADGDELSINCNNCTATNNLDGSVTINGNEGGFWGKVRLGLGLSGPTVNIPIPGTD